MTRLNINLFGYPHLSLDDQPAALERRKTLALAAYLALEENLSPHTGSGTGGRLYGSGREVLAAMFWPEANPQQASAYLRQALWDFSRAVGQEWLLRQGETLAFNSQSDIWVDVVQFELDYEAWKAGRIQPEQAVELLCRAAGLYNGDFLEGFSLRDCPAFDLWMTTQAEILRLHLAQILEILVGLLSRRQDYEQALVYARRWADMDSLNEAAHRGVINLYLETGQRGFALKQYELCRQLLEKELGVMPDADTLALLDKVKQQPEPELPIPPASLASQPSGTVTFLFTDIEGSTHLWETHPAGMGQAFKRHEAIIHQAMKAHGGYIYKMIGDGFQVAFSTAAAGLNAAVEAQRNLHAEPWGEIGQLKVRMALHSGVTEERGDDYVGPELNRIARILGSGYGGQILLSQPTYELAKGYLPAGTRLVDLGAHLLKGLVHAEIIYQLMVPGLRDEFPPLKTISSPTYRLPVMATDFVGREQELVQIEQMLADPDCRLITLLGIGGSGKTRLAIQAASVSSSFHHAACFIPLASAQTLEELMISAASALQFRFQLQAQPYMTKDDYQAQLYQFLAEKRLLLILDNFEQLTEEALFVSNLLRAAPQVKVIVTSRERLNLAEEWVIDVMGLSFPGKIESEQALDYAAVRLFISRAQHTSGTRLKAGDYPAIIRISQLIEGVPLGIEMAAGWVKMLSCAEIAAEIERDLDFLSASWRGMPERQQTLRAVFDHSWRLLSEREREGFINLAVFDGGFTRQAALDTAGVQILMLASLTDKSFLRRLSNGRYEIHPVLLGYAREKLAEDVLRCEAVRAQHALYFGEWMYQLVDLLKGSKQLDALASLRAEMGNIRAALKWLVEQSDYGRLEKLLPAFVLFLTINDQRVATQDLFKTLFDVKEDLGAEGKHPALLALVLAVLCFFSIYPFNSNSHEYFQQESLKVLPDLKMSLTKGYTLLLICAGAVGLDQAVLQDLGLECRQIFRDLRDSWTTALAELILGDILIFGSRDPNRARPYYESSLQTYMSLEDGWGISLCKIGLVEVYECEGDWEQAYLLGLQALHNLEALGNTERTAHLRYKLGELALKLKKPTDARQYFTENMLYCVQQGNEKGRQYYNDRLAQISQPM